MATLNTTIINEIGKPLSSSLVGDTDEARKLTVALQLKSLPTCHIVPCVMRLGTDIKDYMLAPAWGPGNGTYLELLKYHGVNLTTNGAGRELRVYFYPDAPITETFSNNYGDSFIASYIKSLGGEGLTDVNQLLGGKGKSSDIINSIIANNSIASKIAENVRDNNPFAGNALGSAIITAADQALGGSRFDFPFVWKSSGFNANYSINVKLFNPDPNSEKSTADFITGPLCALLCLGLPIGSGAAYSWPFVHIIEVPGFFGSKAVGIQNITVTKGGEQNLRSMSTGFVGMVDVRIDFINLFDPMIAGNISGLNYRTNLTDYLGNLTTPTTSQTLMTTAAANAPSVIEPINVPRANTNLITIYDNTPSALPDDNSGRCKDIDRLTPETKAKYFAFEKEMNDAGIKFAVTETYRTQARQDMLYDQGRTTPGRIVTEVQVSKHTSGKAFDIIILVNGKECWDVNNPNWKRAGQIGLNNGLNWGGKWKRPDNPHFESRN